MSAPASVDAIFIGSGQATNPLAGAFAEKGKRVVVIESKHVGGTCVNEGCTPTKTMIASAKAASQARDSEKLGVHAAGVSVHMDEVRARKREVVDVWRSGSEKKLEDDKNIELVRGLGSFADAKTISVALTDGGTRTFTAPHIFVNTGLRSFTPAELHLQGDAPYLTNESVMELDTLPKHLIILGGSYIAVEFGQMFRRFGSEVTLVSNGSQLLPREDADIAEALSKVFEEDGIHVVLNAKATSFAKTADGISLKLSTKSGEEILHGSHLLLAAGRKPNTESLNLAAAGLKTDDHGFLPTDEKLQTAVPGIYALGDVKGGPAFTHISYDDYRIAAANLLEGGSKSTKDRQVPYTVFTDPELGRIGMTENEARQAGHSIRIASMPASSIARAYETGDDRGLMKIIVDKDSEQILGAAVLAGEGGEIMAVIQTAMLARLKYPVLRDAVWAHPTRAESLNNVFFHWKDES